MSAHDRWADASAAYLLGALPEDEAAAYEAHVAGCADCRAELDELRSAAEALPASVPPVAPPPALKARLMAEVEREAALLAAAGTAADRPRPEPTRRRRLRLPTLLPRAWAPAAVMLAVGLLVGLGLGGAFSGKGGRTIGAAVDRSQAPGAAAELDLHDGTAMIVARNLPAPPGGRVYQVWVQRPGRAPEPTAALFTPRRDGSATATVPGSLEGVAQVLVSSEPPGGSPAPTSKPILVAKTS